MRNEDTGSYPTPCFLVEDTAVAVIPAQAGIQEIVRIAGRRLDSRLRGNDGRDWLREMPRHAWG